MSVQRASSSVPSFTHWKYDVFLSFRGEDTCKNFTDHLYAALNQKGINVFRDDKELERGKGISSEIFRAIEESRSSIIVFSRNYACSTWCLDELVKIVQCKNTTEQMVFPIFYDVEPTEIRKQNKNFQEAFAKHEAFRENTEKVQKWRDALEEVVSLSGWDLKHRHEAEFIQEIVKEISRKLRPTTLRTLDHLVGINLRLKKLKLLIGSGSNDVRMIGICGMGGLGKTTLARVVYDMISGDFEGSSFLANVREISEKDGLIAIQKQLLSETLSEINIRIYNDFDGIKMIKSKLERKKVLVVVDDVDHVSQLNKIAGKHSWFGSGSRIIITTRDEHLLITHRVDQVYKAEALNDDEALELFSSKAFDDNQPLKDYEELTKRVLKYASGLPLAVDVLGSFLFGRTVNEWGSALERLNRGSENEILDILQISFNGLKEAEKRIFLDVACFFKGEDREYVTKILDGCGFDPVIGIVVLVGKSLLTVLENNRLWMHDLLQEMGQQIVKRQSIEEPGKCSRLWKGADVHHVLTKNMGTEAVEGIIVNHREDMVHLSANAKTFVKMTNLRLLKICNVQLPEGLEYLSDKLQLLDWHGYPLKSLPSNLQLDKTVELNMWYSSIEQIWSGIRPLYMLKLMRLGHSQNLIRTPDFTRVPNLEVLILEGCIKLCTFHPSLLVHRKLIVLNLKDCTSLRTLPRKIAMKSLKNLVLSGCLKLKKFPEIVGSMKCLSELFLDGTAIEELPRSLELLTGLALLNLDDCKSLVRLPSTVHCLKSLKTLNLSGCTKLETVPENLGQVESLEELDVSETAIRQPISSIFLMKNLKSISFRGCKGLPSFMLWYFQFPSRLMQRRSSGSKALMLPSLSGLCSLTKLDLSDCNLGEGSIPDDICNLFSLAKLNLSKNNFVSLPASIYRLSKLKQIEMENCKRLQTLPELPSSIENVRVGGCVLLETLSDGFKSCCLDGQIINCINCFKLQAPIDWALTRLQGWLLGDKSIPRSMFSIVVPGSEFPEWFSCKKQGYEITIVRPPDLDNNRELMGYVVCCIFDVHKHLPAARTCSRRTHELTCHMKVDEMHLTSSPYIQFDLQFGQAVSDHIWLLYLSHQEFIEAEFLEEPKYDYIKFYYLTGWSPGLQVKRCGIRPIYSPEVDVTLT